MKKLQILKDSKTLAYSELAGVSFKKERIVGINIEKLYKYSKSEKEFIKLFSEYFTHEWLHIYLQGLGTDMGEEKVIRKLLNQKFTKKEQDYYAKFYK